MSNSEIRRVNSLFHNLWDDEKSALFRNEFGTCVWSNATQVVHLNDTIISIPFMYDEVLSGVLFIREQGETFEYKAIGRGILDLSHQELITLFGIEDATLYTMELSNHEFLLTPHLNDMREYYTNLREYPIVRSRDCYVEKCWLITVYQYGVITDQYIDCYWVLTNDCGGDSGPIGGDSNTSWLPNETIDDGGYYFGGGGPSTSNDGENDGKAKIDTDQCKENFDFFMDASLSQAQAQIESQGLVSCDKTSSLEDQIASIIEEMCADTSKTFTIADILAEYSDGRYSEFVNSLDDVNFVCSDMTKDDFIQSIGDCTDFDLSNAKDNLDNFDYIIETPSFTDCETYNCIATSLRENSNEALCNLLSPLFDSDKYTLQFTTHDVGADGFTKITDIGNGIISMSFHTADCNNSDHLFIAESLLHEGQHAIWYMELIDAGLQINTTPAVQEAWAVFASENFGIEYSDQHIAMAYLYMDNAAAYLWDLNGKQKTPAHYMQYVVDGLEAWFDFPSDKLELWKNLNDELNGRNGGINFNTYKCEFYF